jgi:4-hydroxy-tetrahydrodipicolinate synthase
VTVVCALTTPFTSDGGVDGEAFRRELRWVSPYVDAVFVAGTTGEFPALSDAERQELFEVALGELGADRVIAHVGAPDTRAAVRIAVDAARSGVRRMAALTPYYLPARPDEVLRHFAAIRGVVDGELLAYVFPERTGVRVSPAEYAVLVADGVTGVKLSGEPSDRVAAYVAVAPDTAVYSGNDADLAGVLAAGGTGIVSGCSSAFPEAFRANDDARTVVEAVGASIGRLKYAQRARDLCGDTARMAVQPPRTDERAAIEGLVARYGPIETAARSHF